MKRKIRTVVLYLACSAGAVLLYILFAGNGLVPKGESLLSTVHAAPSQGCNLSDSKGRFLVTTQGTTAFGPQATVGILTSDGTGNFSGISTGSVGGNVFQNVTYTGTAVVNSDCTYTSTTTDQFGSVSHFYGVINIKDEEVHAVRTDAGTVVSLHFKRLE